MNTYTITEVATGRAIAPAMTYAGALRHMQANRLSRAEFRIDLYMPTRRAAVVTVESWERTELSADDIADTLAYLAADGTPVAYLNGYTNGDASAALVAADGTVTNTRRARRAYVLEQITEHLAARGFTAPAPAPALVATMANENSGVPAKLRTYGPLAAAVLGVKCHPANGGGATIDLASDTLAYAAHTDGYYVAGLMPEIKFPAGSPASKYGYALGAVWAATSGRGLCGFWNEDGTIVAEASQHVADKSAALQLARERGERAIWDIAAAESIYV